MTRDEINRSVAEKLGMCWHEKSGYGRCSCGWDTQHMLLTLDEHIEESQNPDYFSDPGKVQLLREMEGRLSDEVYSRFIENVKGIATGSFQDPLYDPRRYLVPTYYLKDTTGLLAIAAEEWLRREGR